MKYIYKIFIAVIGIVVYLSLVGFSAQDQNNAKQSIEYNGDYPPPDFSAGDYTSYPGEQILLSLKTTSAKFTCPKGYVIPAFVSAPKFNGSFVSGKCTDKNGCSVYAITFSQLFGGFMALYGTANQEEMDLLQILIMEFL